MYIGHKIEIICLNTIHHIQLSFQRAFFKEMRLKQTPSPNIWRRISFVNKRNKHIFLNPDLGAVLRFFSIKKHFVTDDSLVTDLEKCD